MIAPGSLPNYRARAARKLVAYRGARRRAKKPALGPPLSASERELLSASHAELPAARVRTRGMSAATVAAGLLGWLGAQARWLRPRAIPAVVAIVGLAAMIASTNYLARGGSAPTASASRVIQTGYSPTRTDMRWQHVALAR